MITISEILIRRSYITRHVVIYNTVASFQLQQNSYRGSHSFSGVLTQCSADWIQNQQLAGPCSANVANYRTNNQLGSSKHRPLWNNTEHARGDNSTLTAIFRLGHYQATKIIWMDNWLFYIILYKGNDLELLLPLGLSSTITSKLADADIHFSIHCIKHILQVLIDFLPTLISGVILGYA